jgi:diaminohydroxyphosphoribosylaminopyrimidine deaminase/5-amino-6-(5-phosphoribosylamino)uracil reductase
MSGKGIRQLRRSGIAVHSGLLRAEAQRVNEDFFYAIRTQSAWVTLKLALTWDGRIADSHGDSKWITSISARRIVHDLRRRHAAIAIGSGTLAKDNPRLTVRLLPGVSPARIVFGSENSIRRASPFAQTAASVRSIVVTGDGERQTIAVRQDGIEVWHTGTRDRLKSMRAFLALAYREGLTSILVEGGQKVASFMLENRLVNRVYFFYGNKILGKGFEGLAFSKPQPLSNCLRLKFVEIQQMGNEVIISGLPKWER